MNQKRMELFPVPMSLLAKLPLKTEKPLTIFAIQYTPSERLTDWLHEQIGFLTTAYSGDEAIHKANIGLVSLGKNPEKYTTTSVMGVAVQDIMTGIAFTDKDLRDIFGSVKFEPVKTRKEESIEQFIYNLQYAANKYAT